LFSVWNIKMKNLIFAAVLLSTVQAQAATRSYFAPAEDGQRIGTCLSDGTSCGKMAADAFCKKAGFAESILFAREPAVSVRILDTGAKCEGATCEAFKRIKCYQPLEAAAANAG
jgi:hypothetical protein